MVSRLEYSYMLKKVSRKAPEDEPMVVFPAVCTWGLSSDCTVRFGFGSVVGRYYLSACCRSAKLTKWMHCVLEGVRVSGTEQKQRRSTSTSSSRSRIREEQGRA